MPKATSKTEQAADNNLETAVQPGTEVQPKTEVQPEAGGAEDSKESAVITNAQIDSEARSMKAILEARPKRTVKLVNAQAKKTGATVPPYPVSINGYVFHIPWNKPVEVPDRVADILERQGLI